MFSGHNADPEIHWQTIAERSLTAEPAGECAAIQEVEQAIRQLGLAPARLSRCTRAVSEAFTNAVAQASTTQSGGRVTLRVLTSATNEVAGFTGSPAAQAADAPGLLISAADRTPRGWGFFLIQKSVDGARGGDGTAQVHLLIELFLYLEGNR